jgi:Flp pilus assembly protein TadG
MRSYLKNSVLRCRGNSAGILSQPHARPFLASSKALVLRFARDKSGSYLIIGALMMPVLVGFVGLGTDYGLWVYTHQSAQSATDSAAVSAATGNTADLTVQANAVTSSYGFVNGVQGATVTVNQPPKSGAYTTVSNAVEVIITQQREPLFSSLFMSNGVTISARSVAIPNLGTGCVIALDSTASGAITVPGTSAINLNNCNLYDNSTNSTALNISGSGSISALSVGVVGGISGANAITATAGVKTGLLPTPDPYASVSFPPFYGCDYHNLKINSNTTLSPGVYCDGIQVNAGAVVTLNPGIYYIDQGSFTVAGNATVNGTGVTIVFTSSSGSNWATPSFSSNSNINLTAPTTGPLAGMVIYGDRRMPVGTAFKMAGGNTQNLSGVIYVPKAALTYAGGSGASNGCTQIVADTLVWTGNSNLALNCAGYPVKPIGSITASLVE